MRRDMIEERQYIAVVVVVVVVVVVISHIGKSLLSTVRAIVTDHSMLLKLYLNNIK